MSTKDNKTPTRETKATRQAKTDRKSVLLRAAYDLLTKADRGHFVEQATEIVVRYDEADCDGSCLREDIADELRIDLGTNPIPIEET